MMLDRFYPIFESADWIERLVPLGIKLVQLRMKDSSPTEIRRHIQRSRSLCEAHGCELIINDHWQAAIEQGCRFVHLGQGDLDQADMGAIRAAGLRVGISTHDKSELARALGLMPDYVALGPIYPTILKKMKWHAQGVDKLKTWRRQIGDIPLVAIGGMTVERAESAFAAGADVVAAVTDITLDDNPEAKVRAWLAATR